jgi:hypothetical protein
MGAIYIRAPEATMDDEDQWSFGRAIATVAHLYDLAGILTIGEDSVRGRGAASQYGAIFRH